MLMLTWRVKWVDKSRAFNGDQSPIIFCLWHNRLALSMFIWERWASKRRRASGLAALISASRDGGLLADVLDRFGVQPVRGSSSRRGAQALREATTCIENGLHVAITPDGPRGPRYKIQDGIIALAQLTGAQIVPVSAYIASKYCTKSWDKFQIPFPFSKCEIRFGETISVPREASEQEREALRQKLQSAMMALTTD